MKLTAVFLFAGMMTVYASSYSQNTKLNLLMRHTTLGELFEKVEELSEFYFFYKNDEIDLNRKIDVVANNQTIDKILDVALHGSGLNYRILDRYIVVSKNPISDRQMTEAVQQRIIVKGTVKNSSGMPIPGVTVLVKGTTQGTVTGEEGDYSLTDIQEDAVLVFSFVGMRTQELAVGSQTSIHVVMQEETIGIEEVVAIGYGVQKKINLTGAVSQVSSKVLKSRPINNVGQGLQGVIPNLNVTIPDGNPNSSPSFNIRGVTTISGESGSPLILVDGIQMNINILNPDDIESISVLKDAASSAIYGARGAFGVILVTTKQGVKERKPEISFSSCLQLNTNTYLPDLFTPPDYVSATNEAVYNNNKTRQYTDDQVRWTKEFYEDPVNNSGIHVYPDGTVFWKGGNSTYDDMLQKWAPVIKNSVSLTGGTKQISYYVSAGYMSQDGLFVAPNTDIFERYNFTLNFSVQPVDWFKIGFKSNFNYTKYDEPSRYANKGSSWWEQMTRGEVQIMQPKYSPDDYPLGGGIPTATFFTYLNSGSRNVTKTTNPVYSVNAEVKVAKNLKINGDFSFEPNGFINKDFQKTMYLSIDGKSIIPVGTSYTSREVSNNKYFSTNLYGDYHGRNA